MHTGLRLEWPVALDVSLFAACGATRETDQEYLNDILSNRHRPYRAEQSAIRKELQAARVEAVAVALPQSLDLITKFARRELTCFFREHDFNVGIVGRHRVLCEPLQLAIDQCKCHLVVAAMQRDQAIKRHGADGAHSQRGDGALHRC